jgi:hypothetical protein
MVAVQRTLPASIPAVLQFGRAKPSSETGIPIAQKDMSGGELTTASAFPTRLPQFSTTSSERTPKVRSTAASSTSVKLAQIVRIHNPGHHAVAEWQNVLGFE